MHSRRLKKYNQYLLAIFLVALLLLIIPTLFRDYHPSNIVLSNYKVQDIAKFDLLISDPYIVGQRQLIVTPYDWLQISLPEIFENILPIVFGMLSIWLFLLILKNLKISQTKQIFILVIFIISPTFIYSFTLNNSFSLIILFNLLGIYLLLKQKYISSAIVYSVLIMFGWFIFLISAFLLLLISIFKNKKINIYYLIPAILYLIYLTYLVINSAVYIAGYFSVKNLVFDLGGTFGFSIFVLIFFVNGWIGLWGKKNKVPLLLVLCLIILSLFFIEVVYILLPIIAFLAGFGADMLLRKKWDIDYLKKFTIFIFFLGIFFSLLVFNSDYLLALPDQDIINGVRFIENSPGIVLTHPSRAMWVETFASSKVYIDSYPGLENRSQRQQTMDAIFHSYDLAFVRKNLAQNDIKYIIIDHEMKEGLVWQKDNQELLYLLTDKNTFKKIYSNKKIEIWSYIYESE